MRLIIEKHREGFTIRDCAGAGMEWPILCAASSLAEAAAFICRTMQDSSTTADQAKQDPFLAEMKKAQRERYDELLSQWSMTKRTYPLKAEDDGA